MKKSLKLISTMTCMLLILLQAQTAFAADGTAEKLSLTLDEAYEIFKKSDTYQLVELQNTRDKAVIKGYTEQISENNETIKDSDSAKDSKSEAKSSNKTLKADKSYAESLYDSNCEARENSAYQEFVNKYYNLKSSERNLEISAKSLELKKEALELAELKYEYGSVSKLDVLSSEISCKQAESSYQSAENSLKTAKMEFCSYLGIDLNTDITLTSEIEEVKLSEVSLEDAITSALENRVEFIAADYELSQAKDAFSSAAAYPKTSATYLKGNVTYMQTVIDCNSVEDEVIIDVTKKYTEMTEKYQAVQLDKMNLESAEESLDLAMSRYELGMSTLTDVQNAQLTLDNAETTYEKDLLSYMLAVKNYEICMGAGTTTVNF